MATMRIGQIARKAGIGVETVRFYERRGLIDPPPRGPSGYREFPQSVVRRLVFIRRAKELGFSLNEIRELLDISLDPDAACSDVKRKVDDKLAAIEEKIKSLRRMKRALNGLLRACQAQGAANAELCPILVSLDGEEMDL